MYGNQDPTHEEKKTIKVKSWTEEKKQRPESLNPKEKRKEDLLTFSPVVKLNLERRGLGCSGRSTPLDILGIRRRGGNAEGVADRYFRPGGGGFSGCTGVKRVDEK